MDIRKNFQEFMDQNFRTKILFVCSIVCFVIFIATAGYGLTLLLPALLSDSGAAFVGVFFGLAAMMVGWPFLIIGIVLQAKYNEHTDAHYDSRNELP